MPWMHHSPMRSWKYCFVSLDFSDIMLRIAPAVIVMIDMESTNAQ
jgi:hypothetical protein